MEQRFKFLSLFFLAACAALVGRLFYWQVIKASELSEKARFQHNSGKQILAHRGNILDTRGSWLAASGEAWLLFASKPELTQDLKTIAFKLAPVVMDQVSDENENKKNLVDEAARIEDILLRNNSLWIPLKHKMSPEKKKEIEALEIAGLHFERQEVRAYPEGSSSAQVLGFVGKNDEGLDKGYFGLEGYYDLTLAGRNGYVMREADPRGAPILFGNSSEVSALGGVDLVTHIDKRIQLLVEEHLKSGIEQYGAKSGSIIIMNPKTGGILAMASYPSFDATEYFKFGNELFKNPIISDSFEPGSIFKPLIMAAGLDAGVIRPETICDSCSGPAKVDKYFIETWDQKYYPNSTMTEVLMHSDNVGMVFVGNRLGIDKLYHYITRFGFGSLTDIDLQGEANPPLRKQGTWNIVDQATATFGQGIAVTPIQMIRAVSIIANGGVDIKPQVVDKLKKDDWVEDLKPKIGDRIISQQSAAEVTEMMIQAVKKGEAKWAVPKGFKVAGKTGTAQIPVSGHYDPSKTNASFIGFAPTEDPEFVMLVTLTEPSSSPWASETSAPLWFKIARELFVYMGIQPE